MMQVRSKINKTIILSTVLFLVVFWIMNIEASTTNENSNGMNYRIPFDEVESVLYVRAYNWGITGSHSEIVISNTPIKNGHRNYSSEDCYIFYSTEIFYKKSGLDTLQVYVNESMVSEPSNFNSPITINLINLKTSSEILDYKTNYKKYELEKISSID